MISGLSDPIQSQPHEDHVQRHDRHLRRQHQRGEHQQEHRLRPRHCMRDRAYATGTHETTTPTVDSPAYRNVFQV